MIWSQCLVLLLKTNRKVMWTLAICIPLPIGRWVSRYQHQSIWTGSFARGWIRRLTVVGDDDQSIHSWRGAVSHKTWCYLVKIDLNLRLIKLEQNYRSTSRILRAANILIANNPHVYEKSLFSEIPDGEKLEVL